ncbi:hypothetical protein D5018_13370 [Parashewanella curva]|uniref:Transmembrane cytochrome oxidase associated protein n=1 Tax=Parashewanella curva TaxID=2338552 RepID=A0A3L8PUX3_9GAMM|nr:hypothetical protein [Parashewanella curva]RLV59201.1 hypothetical protein D5018_13370 [Parashewanella curva]
MTSTNQSSRKQLLLLAAVFALPIIAAQLFLSLDLYKGGSTNKGELLPSSLSYQSLNMDNPNPGKWQMLYQMPADCQQACQQQLHLLQRSFIALGKEQDRVQPVVILSSGSDESLLKQFNFVTIKATSDLPNYLSRQQIITVDPLGKWVTRYELKTDPHDQVMQSKAMLNDLRKLLKLSRVG